MNHFVIHISYCLPIENCIIKLLPEHKVRTINKTCPNANTYFHIYFPIKKIVKYLFCTN